MLNYLLDRSRGTAGISGLVAVGVALAACTTTVETPTPMANSTAISPPSSAAAASPTQATPAAKRVGDAVMRVVGDGRATIRWRINGGDEQVETNVALPWEKQYPVYERVSSEVTADAGDTVLGCFIIFRGDMLVAYRNDPQPRCEFAYWD